MSRRRIGSIVDRRKKKKRGEEIWSKKSSLTYWLKYLTFSPFTSTFEVIFSFAAHPLSLMDELVSRRCGHRSTCEEKIIMFSYSTWLTLRVIISLTEHDVFLLRASIDNCWSSSLEASLLDPAGEFLSNEILLLLLQRKQTLQMFRSVDNSAELARAFR